MPSAMIRTASALRSPSLLVRTPSASSLFSRVPVSVRDPTVIFIPLDRVLGPAIRRRVYPVPPGDEAGDKDSRGDHDPVEDAEGTGEVHVADGRAGDAGGGE